MKTSRSIAPPSSTLAAETLVVSSASDLDSLRGRYLSGRSRRERVRLQVSGVSPDLNERWERRINGAARACGCSEGAMASFIGAAAAAGLIFVRRDNRLAPDIGLVIGGALLGAAIGKAMGLQRAKSRLRRVLAEIEQAFEATDVITHRRG